MLEYPYDDQDERLMERCHWRRLGFAIFIGILLAILLGPLVGCATPDLPSCEKWGYAPVQFNGERAILVDEENIERLKGLISGLAEGKCRLPPDGTGA